VRKPPCQHSFKKQEDNIEFIYDEQCTNLRHSRSQVLRQHEHYWFLQQKKKGEQCDENVTVDMNYGIIASSTLEEHSYASAIQIVQA